MSLCGDVRHTFESAPVWVVKTFREPDSACECGTRPGEGGTRPEEGGTRPAPYGLPGGTQQMQQGRSSELRGKRIYRRILIFGDLV